MNTSVRSWSEGKMSKSNKSEAGTHLCVPRTAEKHRNEIDIQREDGRRQGRRVTEESTCK